MIRTYFSRTDRTGFLINMLPLFRCSASPKFGVVWVDTKLWNGQLWATNWPDDNELQSDFFVLMRSSWKVNKMSETFFFYLVSSRSVEVKWPNDDCWSERILAKLMEHFKFRFDVQICIKSDLHLFQVINDQSTINPTKIRFK